MNGPIPFKERDKLFDKAIYYRFLVQLVTTTVSTTLFTVYKTFPYTQMNLFCGFVKFVIREHFLRILLIEIEFWKHLIQFHEYII